MNNSHNSNVILIVDDSPETLGMLNDALEHADMTTLVALEGKQAIHITKKISPDVILLDAIMPHMDGFETCEKLKSDDELKNIPVIFMTGLSDTHSIVKGFAAGGVDYLTKPINPQELIARINVHLTNARTTISAQNALDSTGKNIFAVNDKGQKLCSTPQANQLLMTLSNEGYSLKVEADINAWLNRSPAQGCKLSINVSQAHITAIYSSISDSGEHLTRLIDNDATDEVMMLKENFNITKREDDVFLWLAKGKANREIALILDMSPRTVNKHLEQLFKKLGVGNRTSAAALAIQYLQKSWVISE